MELTYVIIIDSLFIYLINLYYHHNKNLMFKRRVITQYKISNVISVYLFFTFIKKRIYYRLIIIS